MRDGPHLKSFLLDSLGLYDFWIFLKEVSYAHQGCIYLHRNTSMLNKIIYLKNIIKQ